MGADGYNSPSSGTWHSKQRCSGTVFSGFESMDSKVAETNNLSPCGNCCDGEWPHADADEPPETADRDPNEWIDKIEPGETALKLTEPSWSGPEYVGADAEGWFKRWPMGLDRNVSDTSRAQVVEDLENPEIEVEVVDWSETPLAEEES